MTIAEAVRDTYIARAERLHQMGRDFDAMGDTEKAEEARQGALIVYAASRAESVNPDNHPVQCGICLRAESCDVDVHMGRKRA